MSMFKVKVFINVELTTIHHLCFLLRESIWWTTTVAAFWIHQHILAEDARLTHISPPMTKDSRSYLLGMKILYHETLDQIYAHVSSKISLGLHRGMSPFARLFTAISTDCSALPQLSCSLWMPFLFFFCHMYFCNILLLHSLLFWYLFFRWSELMNILGTYE